MDIEWLILADGAQVVGNKLYLMGGGWDKLQINGGFPKQHATGIALAIKVPREFVVIDTPAVARRHPMGQDRIASSHRLSRFRRRWLAPPQAGRLPG